MLQAQGPPRRQHSCLHRQRHGRRHRRRRLTLSSSRRPEATPPDARRVRSGLPPAQQGRCRLGQPPRNALQRALRRPRRRRHSSWASMLVRRAGSRAPRAACVAAPAAPCLALVSRPPEVRRAEAGPSRFDPAPAPAPNAALQLRRAARRRVRVRRRRRRRLVAPLAAGARTVVGQAVGAAAEALRRVAVRAIAPEATVSVASRQAMAATARCQPPRLSHRPPRR